MSDTSVSDGAAAPSSASPGEETASRPASEPAPAAAPRPAAPLSEEALKAAVERAADARTLVVKEVHQRVVGQDAVIELMLVGLVSRGHCLLVGVPGLAKTLLVNSLADVLELSFSRIQFTPDLMPADITGTDVLEQDTATGRRSFRFLPGPIFANIVLADEINRTPPKTQAALLQAMQEGRVTASGQTFPLDPPFMVFATQNPIEQEGTYPLPEAQLDRFMFRIDVGYPSAMEERRIVAQETAAPTRPLRRVLGPETLAELQELLLEMPVPEHVLDAAVKLCRATRPEDDAAPAEVRQYLSWGAGPRAARFLVLGAKARALLQGRFVPTTEDLRSLAMPVLRHRLLRNFHAEAEGVTVPELLERLVAASLGST
jgi:MoxR-like ATPase